VVLAAEKKVTGKLLDLSGSKEGGYGGSGEKIYLLNSYVCSISLNLKFNLSRCPFIFRNVIGGVAGYTADANSLVNYARTAAQRHLLLYNEDIPVELLAQRLCDMKQGYTQYGGKICAPNYNYIFLLTFHIPRPPPLWCLPPLRRLRSALPIPTIPLRPLRQLLWVESDLYRRKQRDSAKSVEAGI
jgi:hypothetical protein